MNPKSPGTPFLFGRRRRFLVSERWWEELPKIDRYYFCASRNAILWCYGEEYEGLEVVFAFERVLSMSKWERNRKEPGFVEKLRKSEFGPLREINAMEALAYASR
jgi:hypothetical protein